MAMKISETSCGPICQHPACWQSNTRQDKGFPRMMRRPPSPPDFDLDLPTVKVCNMLEDYGEDPFDKFPAKFGGKPAHERGIMTDLQKPMRSQSIKVTRVPQTSPKSSTQGERVGAKLGSKFKVVEVQEVFDPEDLQGTWDDTFVSKSCYVWVPNKKKKRRKSRRKMATNLQESAENMKVKGEQSVKFKDMTEDMVPREVEENRITARKKRSVRSPVGRPFTMTPRTTLGSSKMEFDQEGINELLDLPRDVLIQVLENTRQSDLMSQEKIREIIKRFMPPQLERGLTNASLASNDLLQQKKLSLHEGNKNLRQPQLMETKPVFYLDDDVMDEGEEDEDDQRSGSVYGSLKELYLGHSREFGKYKKPLPSITAAGRAVSAGEPLLSKIPSISLGLPELPSGIRQTKPFTYMKKTEFDFTLEITANPSNKMSPNSTSKTPPNLLRKTPPVGVSPRAPVPTPPTSFRSTGTPGSDHGTTIRVNVPSRMSMMSEHGSDPRKNQTQDEKAQSPVDEPLHAVSPTFSTRVPHAPATTPATYQQSPVKSAPLIRDYSSSTAANTPQEWPPLREKVASPQILRAPVNTPGSIMQEQTALGTIQEGGAHDEYTEQPHPVSRQRSVRFEIPEVPPPPSSPQLSDKESLDNIEEPSRNTVTVNTIIPKETPSSSSNYKPASGQTIRTDANTINTSLQAENSFMKSVVSGPVRELSLVSSPEPWPQVNEADFDVAPVPSPETSLHETPPNIITNVKVEDRNHSRSASNESPSMASSVKANTPEKEKVADKDYVNVNPTATVKKMMEESRKSDSPAPPPPSPEGKEDDEIKIINDSSAKPKSVVMTPVLEETENVMSPAIEDEGISMSVMQISPKGPNNGNKRSDQRQIDTFVNIDIPAKFNEMSKAEVTQSDILQPDKAIIEEPEPSPEETKIREMALSVQSTLAARSISERVDSEMTGSMIEPAMSQASHGPALSEDFSEKRENQELFGDWSGVVIGSEGQDTQAMLSSDRQDLDMTEDGGDHEGFKDDLRQEFERMKKESENSEISDSIV